MKTALDVDAHPDRVPEHGFKLGILNLAGAERKNKLCPDIFRSGKIYRCRVSVRGATRWHHGGIVRGTSNHDAGLSWQVPI